MKPYFLFAISFGITLSTIGMTAHAAVATPTTKPVLADASSLAAIGAEILAVQKDSGVAFARLSAEQERLLREYSHTLNRCGGYEVLPYGDVDPRSPVLTYVFGQLEAQARKNAHAHPSTLAFSDVQYREEIAQAIAQVTEANIRSTVEFLSNFPEREHTSDNPNVHVEAMKARLEQMLKASPLPFKVDLISHNKTHQKTIRVHLDGATRPQEIVVLGGHLDSINQEWFSGKAPGADDNASGSADIIEAMRIISTQKQPERSIEFFLYAGEEGGLLGSAEIARDYKAQKKDVVGVLQLDMTLFPGAGQLTLGSMTDFTSVWLRGYLETLNALYTKIKIVEDKCGYGCSDHASWFRQGYPTLMPFEATFNTMNHNLHTSKDVIDSQSNFSHAAMFARIAVALAMDLSNSTARESAPQ